MKKQNQHKRKIKAFSRRTKMKIEDEMIYSTIITSSKFNM